jgi:outer membrane protein assembly factor BamB
MKRQLALAVLFVLFVTGAPAAASASAGLAAPRRAAASSTAAVSILPGSTAAGSTPSGSAAKGSTRAGSAAKGSTPAGSAAKGSTPAGSAAKGSTPPSSAAAGSTPAGSAATGPTPASGVATPPSSSGAATPTGGWEQDGFGPGNNGYNPAETMINFKTLGVVKPSWTVVPQMGTEGCFSPTTPIVSGGRMFIVDADGVGAYNTTTGKLIWRNANVMDTMVGRHLIVAGGLVVTTGWGCYNNSEPSGFIAALDARTGKVKWHLMQGDAIESVVADGGVLISYAPCEACGTTSISGNRISDGKRLWTLEEGMTGPVSAHGRVLVTGTKGSTAIAATTGKKLWHSAVTWTALAANPAGDRFYTSTSAGLLSAVNAATGNVVWSVPKATGLLAADGRRVYVSRDGVTAYDATTGKKLWHRAGIDDGRPIRAGGLLYVPGAVLSPATGAVLSTRAFSTVAEHAVVAAGRIFTIDGGTVRTYAP